MIEFISPELVPFLMLGPIIILAGMILLFEKRDRKDRLNNRKSPFTKKFLRPPGHSTGLERDQRKEQFDEQLMMLLASALIYGGLLLNFKGYLAPTPILIVMLIYWYFGIKKLLNIRLEKRQYQIGYEGELFTGTELSLLMKQGADIYHDFEFEYGNPSTKTNIDHIIVAPAGVYVVETKAVRKPIEGGQKNSEVIVIDNNLKFPHFTTTKPIEQAIAYSVYLQKFLAKQGCSVKVTPVVSLPGWMVRNSNNKSCIVINPNDAAYFKKFIGEQKISKELQSKIAGIIAETVRDVESFGQSKK